jgi:hypothetical protein
LAAKGKALIRCAIDITLAGAECRCRGANRKRIVSKLIAEHDSDAVPAKRYMHNFPVRRVVRAKLGTIILR